MGTAETITYRPPCATDAAAIAQLVAASPPLDVNSEYAYLLLCTHFKATCMVAVAAGTVVGAVTGYCKPEAPDVLFVWQVAVAPDRRRARVGAGLLRALLRAPGAARVRYLETTISPSNVASRRLFGALASELGTALTESPLFDASLFAAAHEEEALVRIGPLALPDEGGQHVAISQALEVRSA